MRKNARVYPAQVPIDPTAVIGRRIGAFLIDALLGSIVFVVAFLVLSEKNPGGAFFASCQDIRDAGGSSLCVKLGDNIRYAEGTKAREIFAIAIVFSFVNAVILQASSASIGKRIVGLAVVRNDSGAPIGFGKAILRWIVSIVDFACCFIVGFVMMLTVKGHRRLADLAAGSVVVAKSSMGSAPMYLGNAAMTQPQGQWTPPAPGQWTPPAPGQWTPPAPGQWTPPPPAGWMPPEPEPAPVANAEPAAAAATTGPQWDAARNAYIQWEPVSGQWMQFDDAAQEWRPLT